MRSLVRGVAAGAAGLLLVGACGGGDLDSGPRSLRAVLLRAVTSTSESTARVEMRMEFTGLPEPATATMSGVSDFTSGDTELEMDFGSMLGSDAPAAETTATLRVVDGVIYMRLPELGIPGGPRTEWLSIDADEMLGLGASGLSQGQSDPSQGLAYLGGVSDDVREVGRDVIRGTPTTHYAATIDMARALADTEIPPRLRDLLGELPRAFRELRFPIDVWIDAEGRVRRMVFSVSLADILGGELRNGAQGAAMRMRLDFYDFGVPVHVEAPPAGDVSSYSDFFGGPGESS